MGKAKVLIVEDDGIVAMHIQGRLKSLGFDVSGIVPSGEEAVRKAKETHPDIVLMDIRLEGEMDGIEAANQINTHLNIPVVYLTAYAEDKVFERAKITEPFGYIIKPFRDRELHSSLEIALYKHKAEKALQKSYDELERRVEERTAELAKANEKLMKEIDERIQTEEALKESEEKYRLMFDTMVSGFALLEMMYDESGKPTDCRYVNVNPAHEKLTGLESNKIIGRTARECILELEDSWIENYGQVDRTGKPMAIENYVEGLKSWYKVFAYRPKPGFVAVTFENITERRQVEEERIRLATAIEQAAESVIIANRPGTIQYVNPSFERLSGYTQEEIVGQNFRILKSDKHDENFYKKMWDVISRGNVWSGRVINRMKDGTFREFETRISPVRDSSGEIINFVSVNRDVTQEIALEAQLQHAQRMDAIGTLAGGIAHDFNDILFSVIGYTEMAIDDTEKGTMLHDNLQEVFSGLQRASELVKQILTFSRQADQKLKPLQIQLVVREALKLIRSTLPTTIEIKQYISNQCGLVMADASQIHQIVMNLMTNAFHAMEDEGGVLEVTLKEVELTTDDLTDPSMLPGAYVCLTVADTGPGMYQSVISRIFEPYFTTKENGKGTGLGLAVVHGIIKSCKGAIKVYSEIGDGTAFHVYLPVIRSQVETEETEAIELVLKGSERILLVDDEDPIVSMEKQMLERLGYDVTEITSSIEALEAFRAAPDKFDLVITDMTMPNMTGVQLSQKLLEIKPDIPIIICTGFSEKINPEKAKAVGIRGYIMKPIVKSKLTKKIREVLAQE